jgi:hypothetical protein
MGLAAACGGAESVGPSVHQVSAVVVADQCAVLGKQESKHAKEAMDRLVDGCRSVPHGNAHFVVILHPGGVLQFGDADPDAGGHGEIPMCVVSQKLTHSVRLGAPCKMEIRLEESNVAAADAGSK